MSDNNNDWESCMNWSDGCYKVGTIEMLNSAYTIVAYLESSSKYLEWDNYKWNSKIWRSLIMVNENIITANRNYPFQSDELTQECLLWLQELANKNLNLDFNSRIYELSYDEYNVWENETNAGYIENVIDYPIYYSTGQMYNDMYANKFCILSKSFIEHPFSLDIHYSGVTTCAACGEEVDLGDEEVLCEECSNLRKCARCGELVNLSTLMENFCPSCYAKYFSTKCTFCNKKSFKNHSLFLEEKDSPNYNSHHCICRDCEALIPGQGFMNSYYINVYEPEKFIRSLNKKAMLLVKDSFIDILSIQSSRLSSQNIAGIKFIIDNINNQEEDK